MLPGVGRRVKTCSSVLSCRPASGTPSGMAGRARGPDRPTFHLPPGTLLTCCFPLPSEPGSCRFSLAAGVVGGGVGRVRSAARAVCAGVWRTLACRAALGTLPVDAIVQTERTVNAAGCIAVGGKTVGVGIHLSGRRVTVRVDAHMLHVPCDGVLQRTLPSPLTATERGRLHGDRLVENTALPAPQLLRVTRVVSAAGALMVAGCKLQIGTPHRGKVVTVEIHDSFFRILHDGDELSTHPRTLIKEVNRRHASGHAAYGT